MNACAECNAALEPGLSCRDYFHELLALEARVPNGPGTLAHFLAVASYNLQHPSGFVPSVLAGLRRTLADVLGGRATMDDARRRARDGAEGAKHVVRRPGDALSEEDERFLREWPKRWTMTVRDVCQVEPGQYVERVREWASAVLMDFTAV
jgi:hypothetical protein